VLEGAEMLAVPANLPDFPELFRGSAGDSLTPLRKEVLLAFNRSRRTNPAELWFRRHTCEG